MRAAEENRSLSDLTQGALVSYLTQQRPGPRRREEAYQLFCCRPIRLSKKQFQEILKEDSAEPG